MGVNIRSLIRIFFSHNISRLRTYAHRGDLLSVRLLYWYSIALESNTKEAWIMLARLVPHYPGWGRKV